MGNDSRKNIFNIYYKFAKFKLLDGDVKHPSNKMLDDDVKHPSNKFKPPFIYWEVRKYLLPWFERLLRRMGLHCKRAGDK